jgi:hypothetical protein
MPRGLGFVHHSIAILYHEVPNPNITIRNFFIAAGGAARRERVGDMLRAAGQRRRDGVDGVAVGDGLHLPDVGADRRRARR